MSTSSPLPVVVVTGLHQAQRQRAVLELLAANPGSVVLQHDLSHIDCGVVVRRIWDDRMGRQQPPSPSSRRSRTGHSFRSSRWSRRSIRSC